VPSTALTGTATITATDSAGNVGAAALGIVNTGPTTLYFAEGYTGLLSSNGRATFDESLAVLNANPFTATVAITYLIQGGNPIVVTRNITPDPTLRESVTADICPDKAAAPLVGSAAPRATSGATRWALPTSRWV